MLFQPERPPGRVNRIAPVLTTNNDIHFVVQY